jgi:nucleoside-diphosphate-sugar epimerase
MSNEHFFVTGAMGCIGAWVVRNLIRSGAGVTVFDLSSDQHRPKLVMTEKELANVQFIEGDITDTAFVKRSVTESSATHIIHLSALQVPFCKADPPLGAAVNVVGTANMFEAAREAGINQLVYASSAAVYGDSDFYSTELLQHDSPLHPQTLYGVYKQANEGTAGVYWQDNQIASIGLRPYTVYGPGRDQGMTSTPTAAMLAAVRNEAYHISFGGYCGFQFVDDVAKMLIQAAKTQQNGAHVFNLEGSIAHMSEVVSAIKSVIPEASITHEETALPLPKGATDSKLRKLLGEIPYTPLDEGVATTMAHFKAAIAEGALPTHS